jgi:hypothetical protein
MNDLNDLFARDPEQLTKADIADIIVEYREAQAQFMLGLKQAGTAKKARKTKAVQSELDLE